MTAMTQQETGQLLTSLSQRADRSQTRPHQIADRLVRFIGDPDRGQFTGPVQLGEVDRVPSVGLDPLTRLSRDRDGATTTQSYPAALSCRWIP